MMTTSREPISILLGVVLPEVLPPRALTLRYRELLASLEDSQVSDRRRQPFLYNQCMCHCPWHCC